MELFCLATRTPRLSLRLASIVPMGHSSTMSYDRGQSRIRFPWSRLFLAMSTRGCRRISIDQATSKIAMFIRLDRNMYGLLGHLIGLGLLFGSVVQPPPLIESPPPRFIQKNTQSPKNNERATNASA